MKLDFVEQRSGNQLSFGWVEKTFTSVLLAFMWSLNDPFGDEPSMD